MRAARSQGGYALLAALLVTALAAVFASACVAAASAIQGVTRADRAGALAARIARQTLDRAGLELCRRPQRLDWRLSGHEASGRATWGADCTPEATVSAGAWPRVAVAVEASTLAAARRLGVVLELRAASVAQGLGVAHDVELHAPVSVEGGCLTSGGSIRGREWLSFSSTGVEDAAGGPADGVHGDVWSTAAAHALGGIWVAGQEVHAAEPADPRFAADTDADTGAGPVEALTVPPDPAVLAALAEIALPSADLVAGGVLDLASLPLTPPAAEDAAAAAEGYVLLIGGDGEEAVRVQGERPASACPLAIVFEGDAVLGGDGANTSLRGAVVACGHLRVAGPASVTGHLYAARLTVDAPLTVVTPGDWRRRQLPGLSRPVVISVGR